MKNILKSEEYSHLNEGKGTWKNLKGTDVVYKYHNSFTHSFAKDDALSVVEDLHLKGGNITFTDKIFEVDGITTSGKKIFCSQTIPYFDPEVDSTYDVDDLGDPIIILDGKDIVPQVRKKFYGHKNGWFWDQIDLKWTWIWGDLLS